MRPKRSAKLTQNALPVLPALPEFAASSRLLSVRQVSALLSMNPRTVYEFMYKGELPSYKVGRNRKFKFDQIMWWLESKRQARMA